MTWSSVDLPNFPIFLMGSVIEQWIFSGQWHFDLGHLSGLYVPKIQNGVDGTQVGNG